MKVPLVQKRMMISGPFRHIDQEQKMKPSFLDRMKRADEAVSAPAPARTLAERIADRSFLRERDSTRNTLDDSRRP